MRGRKGKILKWSASALLGAVLVVGCYYYWNSPFTFGSGDDEVKRASLLKHLLFKHASDGDGRALPVNISYDRMLVPYTDEWGIPIGDIAITDRSKLLRFCDSLAAWDNYRYLVCDIDFGSGIESSFDGPLFARLAGMRDVVLASSDPGAMPDTLRPKAAATAYTALHSGDGFMKYTYLTPDGHESLALRMWKDIDGGDITKHRLGYTSGGQLCNVSIIPPIEYTQDGDYDEMGEKMLYQIGADILDSPESTAELFRDRIILLGDWKEDDMHDTIRGEQPGIAILYNAFLALEKGRHRIPIWILLMLFVLFTIELRILFRTRKETVRVRSRTFKVIHFLELLFGYSTPLAVVCIVLYLSCGIFVNTMIVGGIFSIIDVIIEQ